MIDAFKTLLQKFVKKECGIDEVTTHLQQLLKKHPQLATPIQGQIDQLAKDKHPKVAVKVLNETFKQFRESFIALQRESSKQQRLAHPNIATVFDFDRDYTYGTVFMTMEFMEGEPLDKYIRRIPPEGLSYEEAKPMIDGMCNGLAYAHHHDLVHSDFKPANTFLNKDGVVKLLDFGIARAAKGLKQALTVSDELGQIRLLAPENEYLAETGKVVTASLLKSIKASKKQSSLEPLTNQFQQLAISLAPDQHKSIRDALDTAWQKAGGISAVITQQRQETAKALEDQIAEVSGKAEFSHEWTQLLQSLTHQLVALLGKDHVTTQQAQRNLATLFIEEANKTSEANRLVQSNILIEQAKYFDPAAPGLAEIEKTIAAALEKQELERIEIERLATISALKQDTLSKAKSEKVDDALRFLDLLKVYLLPDDPFLTTEGPEAIGTAYAGIALRAKKRADGIQKDYVGQRDGYTAALETIKTGLAIAPLSKALASAKANIQNALTITEVRNTFGTADKLDLASLRTQLNRIKAYNASAFARLQTEFSEAVAQRISTMEVYDPKSAKIFLDAAKQLPINQVLLSRIRVVVPEPSKYSKQITELIKQGKLTEASSVLKTALVEESDHADIKRLRGVLSNKVEAANKTYKQYQAALRKNDTDLSKKLIAKAMKIWVDNTEYKSAFKSIKISIIASKAVCQTRLAGHGRRSRGRCYDMVSNTVKGPIMVVLPAGAGHDIPFAISKFEISVAEFNEYCKATKKCQTIKKGPKLPVTGISIAQAKDYIAWLSKISGARYRLPTEEEWLGTSELPWKCTRMGRKFIWFTS